MSFVDRKIAGKLAKRSFFYERHEQRRIHSPEGFEGDMMGSINKGKCHHMAFFEMRSLKIDLILIWANVRNTISH